VSASAAPVDATQARPLDTLTAFVRRNAWTLGLAAVLVARQEPAPTFRSGVELIQLDVSVLDKDRRPVQGLTAADFTVLVDGQPRPIVANDGGNDRRPRS
jgi:hypothetical protein